MTPTPNDHAAAQLAECEVEAPALPVRLPWFLAKCRAGRGSSCEVPVFDLSAGGCLVELGFRAFKVGERVLVSLPGLSAIPGEVVWIEEKDAGIAFEAVLHDAVLEHLTAARKN